MLKSACCSRQEEFLNLLRPDEYYISGEVTIISASGIIGAMHVLGGKLRSVVLGLSRLTPEEGRTLAEKCRNLTSIRFSCLESCTSELWTLLNTNSRLETLEISTTRTFSMEVMTLPPLSGISLPSLHTLSILNCRGDDQFVHDALNLSKNITRLNLSGCWLKPITLLQIPFLCPHLQFLSLQRGYLTDETLCEITKSCVHLVHLNISGSEVTDDGLLRMLQNVNGLQSLSIENVCQLTDVSLAHIASYCAQTLHTLHLSSSDEENEGPLFGAIAINNLLASCTRLLSLYINYWSEDPFFHTGIKFSPATLQSLTKLILRGNAVRAEELPAIGQHGINLQVLGFDDLISCAKLESVLVGCPRLKELYVCMDAIITEWRDDIWHAMESWKEKRPGAIIGRSIPDRLTNL